jgi:hypothetical protein
MQLSLRSFLHHPVTSTLLSPNILLCTLFSNTLNLCPSLNVTDQVSHPYKTTGKITVFYIFNLYVSRRRMRRQKILNCMVASILRIWSALNFLTNEIKTCTYSNTMYNNMTRGKAQTCIPFWNTHIFQMRSL